jgi:hypothetical protein
MMEKKRKALIELYDDHVCTEQPTVAIDTYCSDCIHYKRCEVDAGFREECNYDGHGIPSLYKKMEKVCGCTEEQSGEQYRNYCDSCARQKSGACNVCVRAYDGVPSEYLFELAQKTQAEIRGEILDQAKVCVCTDRKEQYGDAEQSFRCIADLWNAYLKPVYPDICITPAQASMMMVLFKAARDAVANVHKIDTYVDMCGYAACAGGLIEDENT